MKDAFKAAADTEEASKELIEKWQMALLILLAEENTSLIKATKSAKYVEELVQAGKEGEKSIRFQNLSSQGNIRSRWSPSHNQYPSNHQGEPRRYSPVNHLKSAIT